MGRSLQRETPYFFGSRVCGSWTSSWLIRPCCTPCANAKSDRKVRKIAPNVLNGLWRKLSSAQTRKNAGGFCLKRKMSLIGPRPERPAFCAEFEKCIHGWHYRTMVTPGLSGLAQVTGGYDLLPKEKVVLDLWRPSPRRSRRAAPAAPQVDSVDVDMRIGSGQRPVAPLVDGFERLLVQI